MNKKTVKDIDVRGKRVLVRVDFNVPLDADRKITDDRRIVAALPTINYLIDNGARVILMSHLGRPKTDDSGKADAESVARFNLDPVVEALRELLGKPVVKLDDCIGDAALQAAKNLKDGDVMLLENLRFRAGEKKNDPDFAKQLAGLGELYVNDAFGTAHNNDASTTGITSYLTSVAGFLMEKEIDYLGKAMENPERPFLAILGGVKVSGKIGVIDNLLDKVDQLIVGGAMAYTFLNAQGHSVGNSMVDGPGVELALAAFKKAEEKGVELLLPVDTVEVELDADFDIPKGIPQDVAIANAPATAMLDGYRGVDIGPESIKLFAEKIKAAKTVIWNGPMGVFEDSRFAKGTLGVAEAMAQCEGVTIVGGGDSAAAVELLGFASKIDHVSTGGGASLKFFEGKELPGVVCLQDK
ncbi:MAG: phosphoglycerate kinase [Armatimonadetes bacterium]|jgi:3-phosphoglycerate kinase|nr:phosphoglycerate kinase [Armatimonadota bacterium]